LPVKAVFTSSETLFEIQKETIEEVFQCKIFDFYGLAERVAFATECKEHFGKHLNFEYGITELLDNDNNPLSDGKRGYLTGTSLQNYVMPFIRYKTSDISSFMNVECPCGRKMPLIENVTTKMEDIVVTPDGKMISSSILTHPFKPLHNIVKSQLVQMKPDYITVKVVKGKHYNSADSQQLITGLRERLGGGIEITLEFVKDIPCEKSGKFRWIISKVPLPL
jgi:phenylacetate-CoA ligase